MKDIESTDYHIDVWSVSGALVLSTYARRDKGVQRDTHLQGKPLGF